MKRTAWILAALMVVCLVAPSTALALGPVDVDAKVMYWLGDFEIEGVSGDMKGAGLDADFWFIEKLGVTLMYYPVSGSGILDGLDMDYMSLDVKWKVFSPGDNTYIAVGAGYQDTEIGMGSSSYDTSGFRVVAEGAIGFNDFIQGYASYVYLPTLDGFVEGVFEDGDGSEYELGVRFTVKIVDIYAAYRAHNMGFPFMGGGPDYNMDNDGFVVGAGFRF